MSARSNDTRKPTDKGVLRLIPGTALKRPPPGTVVRKGCVDLNLRSREAIEKHPVPAPVGDHAWVHRVGQVALPTHVDTQTLVSPKQPIVRGTEVDSPERAVEAPVVHSPCRLTSRQDMTGFYTAQVAVGCTTDSHSRQLPPVQTVFGLGTGDVSRLFTGSVEHRVSAVTQHYLWTVHLTAFMQTSDIDPNSRLFAPDDAVRGYRTQDSIIGKKRILQDKMIEQQ